MLGADGRPITARGWFDSESLAFDGQIAYVGLELVNQVLRFDFSKGATRSRGEVVPLPLALAGGLLTGSAGYREQLLAALTVKRIRAEPVRLVQEPAEGALGMAVQRSNAV